MKNVLTSGLVALVLSLGPAIQANAFEMRPECRYRKLGGPGWSIQNVSDTATCAARKNHLPVAYFRSIVACESGFNPYPGGSHHGPMQYVASTFYAHMGYFPRYVGWYRIQANPDAPRPNILIAARYMSRYGYSPWACAR